MKLMIKFTQFNQYNNLGALLNSVFFILKLFIVGPVVGYLVALHELKDSIHAIAKVNVI